MYSAESHALWIPMKSSMSAVSATTYIARGVTECGEAGHGEQRIRDERQNEMPDPVFPDRPVKPLLSSTLSC